MANNIWTKFENFNHFASTELTALPISAQRPVQMKELCVAAHNSCVRWILVSKFPNDTFWNFEL